MELKKDLCRGGMGSDSRRMRGARHGCSYERRFRCRCFDDTAILGGVHVSQMRRVPLVLTMTRKHVGVLSTCFPIRSYSLLTIHTIPTSKE